MIQTTLKAAAFLALAAVVACTERLPVPEAPPAPTALFEEFVAARCAGLVGADPPVGTVVTTDLKLVDGTTAARTIRFVRGQGNTTGLITAIQLAGMTEPLVRTDVTLTRAHGLLPGGSVSDDPSRPQRGFRYSVSPEVAIAALEVGESASLPVTESRQRSGELTEWSHVYQVKLESCGQLPWMGAPEDVHVYRTVTAYGRDASAAGEPVEPTPMVDLVYVSDQYGWILRRQTADGGVEVTNSISFPR